MNRHLVLMSCLAFALGTAGCQDQSTEPSSSQRVPQYSESGGQTPHLTLPSSSQVTDRLNAVDRVINPNDYVCDPSTPIMDWFTIEANKVITQERDLFIDLFVNLKADQVPASDALFLETEATPQFFGYTGEYTKKLQRTERDVKRFWDIFSDDIQLIGLHGTMLLDTDRVAATYETAFEIQPGVPVPPDLAQLFAQQVHEDMLASQTLNGGNHPLFSFNSFAVSSFGGPIPDKIVIGDGILEGFEVVGFGDVAPKAIYAHEFSHHIQYEHGYNTEPIPGSVNPDPSERNRYNELMADAMAGYYLTHKKGAGFHRRRVEQFLQIFFQIGDCAFNTPTHHGTPNQRMAAARFGFDVAHDADRQGKILSSQAFHDLFVQAFPAIVAPDAPPELAVESR
jgi:hypothetical protein